jgi:hypothetical protein
VKVIIEFVGEPEPRKVEVTWEEWQGIWKSKQFRGKKVHAVEVESESKGHHANRISFL